MTWVLVDFGFTKISLPEEIVSGLLPVMGGYLILSITASSDFKNSSASEN